MDIVYGTLSAILAVMLVASVIAAGFFFAEEIEKNKQHNPKPEAKVLEFKSYGLSKWELSQTTGKLLREDRKRKNRRRCAA